MPQTPCLFAPATPLRAGDANCRRCNSIAAAWRSMFGCTFEADLGRDAGALDQLAEASDCERCTPLETKVKADLAARFSTRSDRKSILERSETYTVSPSATNSAMLIK